MIRAAIVGLGWWGQNLVNSVRQSEGIRFTTAHTRTRSTAAAFCETAGLSWVGSLQGIPDDPAVDPGGLRTPAHAACRPGGPGRTRRQARVRREAIQPLD